MTFEEDIKSINEQKELHHVGWPNLYDEAYEFLRIAILMYGIADMRQLARDGELPPEMARVMLNMPVRVLEANKTFAQYLPLIEEKIIQKDEDLYHLYFSCCKMLFTKAANELTTYESAETNDELMIDYSDQNSDKELVYAISVNRTLKRIEIGFRGSVTTQDWVTDVKYNLVELQDPGDEDNVVLVHQGFKEYLYGKPRRKHHLCKSSSHTSSEKEAHASKVETITNQVIELLDEYPGYMIYTTGHSLGGALCTLLAFELAGNDDERIPKPISCISFASPKVGNRKFANAFQALEKKAQLRCLRVWNQRDVVAQLPKAGVLNPCLSFCFQRLVQYRHVGMELELGKGASHRIGYPKLYARPILLFLSDTVDSVTMTTTLVTKKTTTLGCSNDGGPVINHSCKEYFERLSSNEEKLKVETLNDLYRRQQIDLVRAESMHSLKSLSKSSSSMKSPRTKKTSKT